MNWSMTWGSSPSEINRFISNPRMTTFNTNYDPPETKGTQLLHPAKQSQVAARTDNGRVRKSSSESWLDTGEAAHNKVANAPAWLD